MTRRLNASEEVCVWRGGCHAGLASYAHFIRDQARSAPDMSLSTDEKFRKPRQHESNTWHHRWLIVFDYVASLKFKLDSNSAWGIVEK